MDLSVIIINYNTALHLSVCLSSIIEHTKRVKFQVIVVDNNSPEKEILKFPVEFPSVEFYFRNVNDGFGGGCDFGAQHAKGKYLAFINPDIILNSDSLSDFYDYMENNPETGLCAGLLVNNNNEPIYSFNKFPDIHWEVTEALLGNGKAKIDKLIKSKRKYIVDRIPFEIDWAIGADMFIRKDVYEKIGGFDKDFFLYSEDVDLQIRLRKLGYKIICLPSVKLYHHTKSSVALEDGDNIYQYNIHKSKLIFMYKHFSIIDRIIVRAGYIAGFLFRIMILPFRSKFEGHKTNKLVQLSNLLKFYLIPGSHLKYNSMK